MKTNLYESKMINELKESSKLINKVLKLDDSEYSPITRFFEKENIILTWMWSSFFISNIWEFFLKHIAKLESCFSVSSDELWNRFPWINNKYNIFTFSQSGNTKEVMKIIDFWNKNNLSHLSLINNDKWLINDFTKDIFNIDIITEKAPVSTKYIIYTIALLYKVSINIGINWKKIDSDWGKKLLGDLDTLNSYINNIFNLFDEKVKKLAKKGTIWKHFIVVWDWLSNIVSKEISLKIRETTGLNASYDNSWQLIHWWINSINTNTICITFNLEKEIIEKIKKRWGEVITIGHFDKNDINLLNLNIYLNSILDIIIWQLYVHYLACNFWIDTDVKNW